MEIRTAGGLLPTVCRSLATSTRNASSTSSSSIVRRSTTHRHHQSRLISSTPLRRQDQLPSSEPSSSSSSSSPRKQLDFSAMINQSLAFTKSKPSSSLDDMAQAFSSRNSRKSNALNIAQMLDPVNRTGSQSRSHKPEPVRLPEPLPAYGPSVGRTVHVDPNRGMDVARAFRSLEMNCARNRIKADFHKQRFHERPGLKRKRLRSERWRRRFKEGFRGMVRMVSAMKKQGW